MSTTVGVQLTTYSSSVNRNSLQSTACALAKFAGLDVTHKPCVAIMSRVMTRLGIAERTIEASSTIDMGQSRCLGRAAGFAHQVRTLVLRAGAVGRTWRPSA